MSFTVNNSKAGLNGTDTSSVTISIASGHTIVAIALERNFTGTTQGSFHDSGSNTYTNGSSGTAPGGLVWSAAYAIGVANSVTSVSFTTGTAGTNAVFLYVWDITATGTISFADGKGVYSNSFSTSTDAVTTGSLTVTSSDALLLGAVVPWTGDPCSIGTGFTADAAADPPNRISEHKAITASGAVTFTLGSSGNDLVVYGFAFQVSGGGGTALTGQSAASTAGTVTQSRALAVLGQGATSTAGTVTPSRTIALTGQSATSAAGTVTPSRTLALTGQAATFTPGTITASTGGNVTLALTGQAATFTAGTLGLNVSFALTGQGSTSAAGTLTPSSSIALTGQSATFTAGTILPSTTIGLNGQGATFSTGTVGFSAGGNVTLGLTGQAFTSTAGTLTASTALALLGQSATFSAGNLSPQAQLALSGQGAVFNAGTITITGGDLTLALNGQRATFTPGTITATGGTIVVTNTGAGSKRVRSIYRITIDGVRFELRTYAEAIALLEKAKATAAKLAEDQAIWAVANAKPLELKAPKIEAPSPELQAAVTETRRDIAAIYERELATIELRMLLELAKRGSDDDETLLLLM